MFAHCFKRRLLSCSAVLFVLTVPATNAVAVPRALTISAQSLDEALAQFAREADVQVLYAPKIVRGRRSNPVQGAASPEQALRALLTGTGVRIKRVGNNGRLFVLEAAQAAMAGRVVNAASGEVLPGAAVRLQDTRRSAVTDRSGGFSFPGLAPGQYRLVVSYAGFTSQTMTLNLPDDGQNRTIRLAPEAISADAIDGANELLVVGRRHGQSLAINLQRNSDSFRTVVSADALGQIREGNIGDALVRLPGLSVETRAGVQRTATIRGLAPQYNAVTVDGLRMTNVDGNRDIALDSFPSNMIARVAVIKTPTPDMSSDAIGGTVDLVTPSAFDTERRVLKGTIGGTYNARQANWNYQAGITFADTFGSDKQFGILASVEYFHDERGYDVVQTGYTVQPNGTPAINRTLYYDRGEVKDRVGAGMSLDYRPTSETSFFARGLYMYDFRELEHRSTDYRPNTATLSNVTATGASSTGGRIDLIQFYREPKNVFQMYMAGVRHRPGAWDINARIAWSKADKDYPTTLQITNSINGLNLTYDRSVVDFPTFRVDNGVSLTDPTKVSFRQLDINQVPRSEHEWTLDGNIARDFDEGALPWRIEVGLRASWKDASQAQPLTARYSGLTGTTAGSLLEPMAASNFLPESNGRAQLLTLLPDWRAYAALLQSNPERFTQNAAASQFTQQTLYSSDFSIGEDILSGYVQGSIDIGDLHVLGGARVERTATDSRAFKITTTATSVTAAPVSASNSYTNVLPSLHLRYGAMDGRLVLRTSVTTAVSRPPQNNLAPGIQENAQANQRVIGNPNLMPAEALNLDDSAEYFFPPLGLLSVSGFYKDIRKFVFSSSRIASDGVDERSVVNGEGGKVKGIELAWVQQFTGLPGLLSGLGVEVNYAYLDTVATYPGRADRLAMVNSPSYIFNGIASYTRGPFDIRVSYNKLPRRIEAVGASAALDSYYAPAETLDLAFKLRLFGKHSLFLNVKNLTNEPTVLYQGSRDLPTTVTYYDVQWNGGLKFEF